MAHTLFKFANAFDTARDLGIDAGITAGAVGGAGLGGLKKVEVPPGVVP